MASKLRVGLIGCGDIGRNHVYGYMHCGRYQLVAIADLSEPAMEQYDSAFEEFPDYHPKHYVDAMKMLDEEALDVVSVATWHTGHSTWTIAAAAHSPAAILCEKPMAVDIGTAHEMRMVCQRNGVKLAIAHQRRFLPSFNAARKLISEGAVGDVILITSESAEGLPNYATHHMDMFRYLLADADCQWVMGQVERSTDRYERNTRIEDRAVVALGFEGGARAHIVSDLTSSYNQGCTIYGSQGIIELYPGYLKLLNNQTNGHWDKMSLDGQFFPVTVEPIDLKSSLGLWSLNFEMLEAGAAQANEMADWIEEKITYFKGESSNGYKAIEMIHAVYESARLHERVTLPLKTRVNPLDIMVESGHLPIRHPGRYDIRAGLLRGENTSSDEDNS